MLFVVLPAYNEEQAIPPLFDGLRAALSPPLESTIIVVDDGSLDGTVSAVQANSEGLNVILVQHEVNKGLGMALKTGLTKASAICGQDDIIVTMDADNTHDPMLIPRMVATLRSGYDVVIASRYAAGGEEVGLSYRRRIFSRGASLLLQLFFPISGARDYTCGYRAYHAGLLKRAFDTYGEGFIEERGFTCMAEILIKLARLKARVIEVPLVLRYDLKTGKSKMKAFRTIGRYLVLMARGTCHTVMPSPR